MAMADGDHHGSIDLPACLDIGFGKDVERSRDIKKLDARNSENGNGLRSGHGGVLSIPVLAENDVLRRFMTYAPVLMWKQVQTQGKKP
jgi:hypothetical protein